MTICATGQHDFPFEDETGAHCPEHGVTLVWKAPPLTDADLVGGDGPTRTPRPALGPAPSQHPH